MATERDFYMHTGEIMSDIANIKKVMDRLQEKADRSLLSEAELSASVGELGRNIEKIDRRLSSYVNKHDTDREMLSARIDSANEMVSILDKKVARLMIYWSVSITICSYVIPYIFKAVTL